MTETNPTPEKKNGKTDPKPTEQAPQINDPIRGLVVGPRSFEGSIWKIDNSGNEVLSDFLLAGEQLRYEVNPNYIAARPEDRR